MNNFVTITLGKDSKKSLLRDWENKYLKELNMVKFSRFKIKKEIGYGFEYDDDYEKLKLAWTYFHNIKLPIERVEVFTKDTNDDELLRFQYRLLKESEGDKVITRRDYIESAASNWFKMVSDEAYIDTVYMGGFGAEHEYVLFDDQVDFGRDIDYFFTGQMIKKLDNDCPLTECIFNTISIISAEED